MAQGLLSPATKYVVLCPLESACFHGSRNSRLTLSRARATHDASRHHGRSKRGVSQHPQEIENNRGSSSSVSTAPDRVSEPPDRTGAPVLVKPGWSSFSFETAMKTLQGYEVMQKDRYEAERKAMLHVSAVIIAELFGVALEAQRKNKEA